LKRDQLQRIFEIASVKKKNRLICVLQRAHFPNQNPITANEVRQTRRASAVADADDDNDDDDVDDDATLIKQNGLDRVHENHF
jgi:hypothetical protein